MTELLTELLDAGLIEKLDGDDERFARIERAAAAVTQELRDQPPGLIRAVLAGLDPDVPADDPAISQAKRALVAEWKSVSSLYTDVPVALLRAILLEACNQAADGNNAAIVWLTAADTLPQRRLGREEPAVRRMLQRLAFRTEEVALDAPATPADDQEAPPGVAAPTVGAAPFSRKVDRQGLLQQVTAAAGPHSQNQPPIPGANPHWPQQGANWSWEFSARMHTLLADQLDGLAAEVGRSEAETAKQLQEALSKFAKDFNTVMSSHRQWVQEALKDSEHRTRTEQLRLDALWWSKALYSPSVRCSYRELPAPLATAVMAVDLLAYAILPSPASVGYLLAEAVSGLPEAGFDRQRGVLELFGALREARGRLPNGWTDSLIIPPNDGRLTLRDIIVQSLALRESNLDAAMRRAGLSEGVTMSLPALAHAFFRQEQAVRLAQGDP